MARAVLIRTAEGPGAIVARERDVHEPRIGALLTQFRATAVNPAEVVM